MLSICTILLVICYLVKFFLFSVCYYQIGEIKLYINYLVIPLAVATTGKLLTAFVLRHAFSLRLPSFCFISFLE